MESFEVVLSLVKTNVLSPNKNYYYKIKEPQAINPSAFAAKIIFLSIKDDSVIYFNSKVQLHELHSKTEIERKYQEMLHKNDFDKAPKELSLDFVWWSSQGNMCHFLEYKVREYSKPQYESVFLNLRENYCYRIDEMQNDFAIVDSLRLQDRQYDENTIIKKLKDSGLHRQPLIRDKLPQTGLFEKLFGINKWYPDAKSRKAFAH